MVAFQIFGSVTGHLHRSLRRSITHLRGSYYYSTCRVRPVAAADGGIGLDSFRSLAWEPAIPMHLRDFHHLPAMKNWFTCTPEKGHISFGHKLQAYAYTLVSYELIIASGGDGSSDIYRSNSIECMRDFHVWLKSRPDEEHSRLLCGLVSHVLETAEDGRSCFLPFEGPLSLIIQAHQYNMSCGDPSRRIRQLYIAQSDIGTLPVPLREDLPVPEIVNHVGKGDVYSSSIWLGLQPTYTSLHRDPNPNLFCQVVGSKAVRLLPPKAGLSVFQQVRRGLGAAGNSRLRGPEMMEGPERDGLHRAIWADQDVESDIWQAVLGPGDALFIPQGWWHSVTSIGHEAELNASANWWFR